MREILIADKSGERCDVVLYSVATIQLLGGEVRCKTEDGVLFDVAATCLLDGGLNVAGINEIIKPGALWPPTDGLFALSRDGMWVEARRQ